ncbi:hypothetical protein [uncultured Mucilaginibacter sp.]|uniref:hypothetical protein n=1 Tax=uncultured Mucilaginibacter sp. TaxID=797541 RepID=UPI0025E463DD|nr:hypothetical protein [uncultured Mucilaginibacter sp.]
MKKILLIAALFVSTGIVSSCTKEKEVAPTVTKVAGNTTNDDDNTEIGGGGLGTGDGGVERPGKP